MPTLIVLNPGALEIQSVDTVTGAVTTLVAPADEVPDGVVVDKARGVLYWTNMGTPDGGSAATALTRGSGTFNRRNGSLERANLDGSERATVLPSGSFVTGKQLVADFGAGKLYFCDREGLRVLRANLDGTGLEVLVQNGDHTVPEEQGDVLRHCVGIAVDPAGGHLYWTQKGPSKGGLGRIFRAPLVVPADPASRDDAEILWENLPEPIDLCLDLGAGEISWTDRGSAPEGNTLNRAPIPAVGEKGAAPTILASGFREAIGVDRDEASGNFYVTDLGGNIREVNAASGLDRLVATLPGGLTGVAVLG
ncbi:hypothetical protein [Segniliparus rugosus]|uniref:Uncharacterized protein n=1 Tax=Segniliparus rugosus (strain ATCC BAA-974 / DSM 45345 / CCUG 50838 / CIP 108380 / JCM 13579 / CDC 945) TaxID=679197 RepID=E5XN06_SEGRC|nr:hypothetical protein [Segniliparus rugosus]EFV14264.1 hypothetical protein HMPREF9336_00876 [Segniliparus rugosus ATCC BAA-974]